MRATQAPPRRFLNVLAALAALALVPNQAHGLSLEQAIAQALARNERARSAEETARAAEARVDRARSFLLPTIGLSGEYSRRMNDEVASPLRQRNVFETRATIDQTVLNPRSWPLLQQAREARDAARYGATESRRRLSYETAESFLDVLARDEVTSAAVERLDLARRNLADARVRFDAQLVGSNDVTRAELEEASAEREMVSAQGNARVARLSLGHLLGAAVEDSLIPPTALLYLATQPAMPLELAAPDAVARRPDIQGEEARVASLKAAAREPTMRYFPGIGFQGSAGRSEESDLDGRDEEWSLGLVATWNVFDGGIREADRAERSALARAAELDLSNLERRVAVDIESARVTLESQQASLVSAEATVRAARRNVTETSELYRRGLVRALEVVDANVQLFEAEVERTGAQYALALAYLDLRLALGYEPLATETDR